MPLKGNRTQEVPARVRIRRRVHAVCPLARHRPGAFAAGDKTTMNKLATVLVWPALALLGAFSLGTVALHRGESVNAVWLVTAGLCVYFIAYRFYSKFIAERALGLDDTRPTPANRHNDGMD
jgi:hypothetical protein